jgi:hypothetical protein
VCRYAWGEVMAKPAGVTMTATFPVPPVRALARADPRDVRETLALVIDAVLVVGLYKLNCVDP